MKRFALRALPFIAVFAAVILFSYPYWGRGSVPFPSTYLATFFAPWSATNGMPVKNNAMPDVITQIYPWKRLTINSWKLGQIPLWNPYSFAGTSHAGTYQPAIFSPANLLFFVLPEIHAWSVMILLQPLLAGVFMYLFLRSQSATKTASVLGSFAFMFCGFSVVWMAYGTLVYAVLWLPLILYFCHVFIEKGSPRHAAAAAVSLALSFLSGHFQISLYVLLYVSGFLLYKWVSNPDKRRRIVAAAGFFAAGLLLAAPQILPALDSYSGSVRSSLFAKGEVIPWQYLVTLFAPDFFGNPVTRNDWFGHYAEWASFIGVIPLMLALLAVFSGWKSNSRIRFFAVAGLVSLLFAYETPLVNLLYALRVPVLSTSAASRVIVLFSFSLAALSAFGTDTLRGIMDAKSWSRIRVWYAVGVTLLLAIWGLLLVLRPLPPDKLAIAVRNTVLPTVTVLTLFAVTAAGMVASKKIRSAVPVVLALLTVVEVYRFSSKWMPFDPVSLVYPEVPVLREIAARSQKDYGRVFGNIGGEAGVSFGLPLIEGYDAVYPHRYGRLMSSVTDGRVGHVDRSVVVFNKRGTYSERMLQLLGVRYYLHKKSDGRYSWAYPFWEMPQYRMVWEDGNFEIWENTASLPRAVLASRYRLRTGEQEILDSLYDSSFDPAREVILEERPGTEPSGGAGKADIVRYTANEVRIRTESDSSKILFLSDAYDPGWKAYVDGSPARVYRANFDFRAVAVPAGAHTVTMRYMPQSVVYGLALAGFATLGLLAVSLSKRKL